jgi:TPP-dependent pyruvate/acetoin dehydrogenase alpha subunit
MSTYRDFPSTASDRLQEYETMRPTDALLEEPVRTAKKWLNSAELRDKASRALKYAEKHPQRVMLASLALGLMMGALRRGRRARNGF